MGQRCRVCTHSKRDEINRELLKPTATLAAVADKYGLSTSSLDRHKANHLKVSLQAVSESANARTIVGYASDLYDRAARILDRAEQLLATEDGGTRGVQAAAASLREVRGSIELLAKLVVSAPEAPPDRVNSWIDEAIALELATMRPPELPAGAALPSDVADAELVDPPA